MITKHKLLPEGKQYLTITEVIEYNNINGDDIMALKFSNGDGVFTIVTFNLSDGMYGINRARSLLHALKIPFTIVTKEILQETLHCSLDCEVSHQPYTANTDIMLARLKFL